MANEVTVVIVADAKQAEEAFRKIQNSASKSADKAAKSFSKMDIAFGAFVGSLGADIFRGVVRGASKLFDFFVTDGVKAAKIQEEAINQLNTALKLTGQFTSAASIDLQNFASQMQETTKFSDDVILNNAALIQSLGDLTTDGLKRATSAAADMSAALGIDLRAAATLVGKAASGEISSFTRYGLVMQKGATTAETFENALTSLEKKFGGSAQAQVKTFEGGMVVLGNTIEDLQKQFGFLVIQNPALLKALQSANGVVQDLAKYVKSADGDFSKLITVIGQTAATTFRGMAEAVKLGIGAFITFNEWMERVGQNWRLMTGTFDTDAGQGALDWLNEANEDLFKQQQLINNLENDTVSWLDKIKSGLIPQLYDVDAEKKKLKELETIALAAKQNIENFQVRQDAATSADIAAEWEKLNNELNAKKIAAAEKEAAERTAKRDAEIAAEVAQEKAAAEAKAKAIAEAVAAGTLAQEQIDIAKRELDLQLAEEDKIVEQEFLIQRIAELELIKADARIKELEAQGNHLEALKAMEDKARLQEQQAIQKANQQFFNAEKAKQEFEKKTTAQKFTAASDGMNALVELQSVKSKEAFAVGKAAAVAQTLLSIPEAAQKAFNALAGIPIVGPALGGAAAAAAVISGVSRLNQIKSAQPGFADGGIVGGNSFTGDRVQANVNSGEMILNRRQQENLFEGINGGNLGGGTVINIAGNVVANDESQVQRLINQINDAIEFNNVRLRI